ncbi:MAG: segregation/condensation protein A [Candidatus Hinthialibacter antarcticus]|nr:segregation/condensation protein A [Candidatus Hinthialibacter antarcticus]
MNENAEPTRLPIDVPSYTGPLDLLVHLISKHEMDVCTINIGDITEAYLKKIREMDEADLEEGGEYLVLGATLIRYKARALLPKDEVELEEEEIDDQILEMRRLEYERFRALADDLKLREETTATLIARVGPSPESPTEVLEYSEVSVYDLHQTFSKIIQEIGASQTRVVEGETFSVDEKMFEIEALLSHNQHLILSDYLRTLKSKLEIIVAFLALLELIRLKEVQARQDSNHGEIVLEKGEKYTNSSNEDDQTEGLNTDGQQGNTEHQKDNPKDSGQGNTEHGTG